MRGISGDEGGRAEHAGTDSAQDLIELDLLSAGLAFSGDAAEGGCTEGGCLTVRLVDGSFREGTWYDLLDLADNGPATGGR